jgi:hypothetical protein
METTIPPEHYILKCSTASYVTFERTKALLFHGVAHSLPRSPNLSLFLFNSMERSSGKKYLKSLQSPIDSIKSF